MARHRKQSANPQKHVGGLAVLAFLGLSVAQAPIAAADDSANKTSSSSGTGAGGADAGSGGTTGTTSTTTTTTGTTTSTTDSTTPGDSGSTGTTESGSGSSGSVKDDDGTAAAAKAAAEAEKAAAKAQADADKAAAAAAEQTTTGGEKAPDEKATAEDTTVVDAGTTTTTTTTTTPETTPAATTESTLVTEEPAAAVVTEAAATADAADASAPDEGAAKKLSVQSLVATETDTETDAPAADVVEEATTESVPVSAKAATQAVTTSAVDDLLPDYPTVDGLTDTEVAAVALIALAAATVAAAGANPLLAIPLALFLVAAWNRFSAIAYNTPPEVTYTQSEPLPVLGTVTGKVTGVDAQNDPILYTVTKQGESGLVIVNPLTGDYSYTPYTLGVVGVTDSFEITADDTLGVRNHPLGTHYTAVTINVDIPGLVSNAPEFEQAPTVTSINPETGVVTGKFKVVDPDGGSVHVTTLAAIGNVAVSEEADEDGAYTFTYTPWDKHASILAGQLTGSSDTISFIATDDDLLTTIKTVSFNLSSVANAVPTATYENTGSNQLLGTVTGKIIVTDADDTVFNYTPVLFDTEKGSVAVSALTGDYTFFASLEARQAASKADATAADKTQSFTITVDDFHGGSVDVLVTVDIPTINIPVSGGAPSNLIGDADGVVRGNIWGVINLDGDDLTYTLEGGGSTVLTANGGIAHVNSDGSYVYVPRRNDDSVLGIPTNLAYGDSFNVVVSDGDSTSTITVPVLTVLSVDVSGNRGVGGVVTGSVDDTTANAALLSYSVGTGPSKGSVTVNTDGTYTYTSATAGPGETDTFTIIATAYGKSVTLGTVTVQPYAPNTAPTSDLVGAVTAFDADGDGIQRGNIHAADADGDALTITINGTGQSTAKLSSGAIVTVDSTGKWVYIPPTTGGVLGLVTDGFTLNVSDGRGGTTSTSVGVSTPLLDIGSTASGFGTVTGGLSLESQNVGLMTYSVGSGPSKGTVVVNQNGTYTYTATTAGYNETDSFTIIGTINGVSTTVATVSFVPKKNATPTSDLLGGTLAGNTADGDGIVRGNVHANDADNDTLTYSVTGYGGAASYQASNGGVVMVDSAGKWTYIPPSTGGILGLVTENFTVYVSDGKGGQTSTAVSVTTGLLDIGYTNTISGAATVTGTLNLESANAGLLNYSIKSPVTGVTVNANGTYAYSGTTEKTFTIVGTDQYGHQIDVQSVTVTPNQKPDLSANLFTSGQWIIGVKTGGGDTIIHDPEGAFLSGTGTSTTVSATSGYVPGNGYVIYQPNKKGTVTVSKTGTSDLLDTTTFNVQYTSTSSSSFGYYPTEKFYVTYFDQYGAYVTVEYNF